MAKNRKSSSGKGRSTFKRGTARKSAKQGSFKNFMRGGTRK